jgi:hypothetical protein
MMKGESWASVWERPDTEHRHQHGKRDSGAGVSSSRSGAAGVEYRSG